MTAERSGEASMGVTGNAMLLLGYIGGLLVFEDEPTYRLISVDAASGSQVLEHRLTENTYRVHVEQLSGSE